MTPAPTAATTAATRPIIMNYIHDKTYAQNYS
jgi:hypothetical protein